MIQNEINETKQIAESLSEIERKTLPYLEEKNIKKLTEKTGLDKVSILRALSFLKNKGLIKLKTEKIKIVELGVNGILYKKIGLPERRLLNILEEKNYMIKEAKKFSKLSNNEFAAALGALKNKALIEIKKEKIFLKATREELMKKTLEEKILEILPKPLEQLEPEELHAVKTLEKRKNIIEIKEEQKISFSPTELGIEISKIDLSSEKMIEEITPDLIKNELWKGKKFRRYDILSDVPKIYGGKKHFVNQAIEQARKIWTEMGFKEIKGNFVQTSFWNFDALFTAQNHPVRELQDTFYIKNIQGKLPDKKIVKAVKNAHEGKIKGSKGWQYKWKEEEAKKLVLRTHTTCLSAKTLAELKEKRGKFFVVGKCFRNETVDANHLFEFNQTEGIVIDKNVNFKHLLGYLEAFLKKMGFKKVRFRPHFFPYTEPSVEADVLDEKTGKWVEILGAGILRPEVVIPLLGEYIPVLAWGMGFDRIIMQKYKIKDIRELYKNNLTQLRKIKFW